MIGPHEGKELELMLAGKKHLAAFGSVIPADGGPIHENIIPEQLFATYVINGTLKRFEEKVFCTELNITGISVCFTTPRHEWRAEAYFCLQRIHFTHGMILDAAYAFMVGRLLGYGDQSIRDYIRTHYNKIFIPDGGTLGPHEGAELELMLLGQKPLTYFSDAIPENGIIEEWIIPEKLFAPHVASGTLKRFEAKVVSIRSGHTIAQVCFALPGHEWRAEEFLCLHKLLFCNSMWVDAAYEFIVGRLLGYTDADIKKFVRQLYRNKEKKQLADIF